ncbi:MAG TPA: GldG family protein [Chthoniobacterales bacterium]|nr:GldG family protein [Chthoniobacterales bacterium]
MKTKNLERFLYSTIGVIAMLLILVAFNLIAAQFKQRVDLTAERAYTLSPGTRAILAKLDTPVQVRFYCTRNVSTMPVVLTTHAQRVEDLLDEYRQASKGKIEIQRLNPEPDSDAEDSARLDGVEGQPLRSGERIYLGLSVSMLDQKQTIPFFAPDRERLLEYDISRAIARVMATEKPSVGVMSSLPVMGQINPMMQRQQRGQRAWALIDELKRDFTIKQVEMTADKIPDDIKLMLVIHPKAISDATQFALDQFVLRGGKLVAFLDPMCALDRPPMQTGMMPQPSASNLEKLFQAWGLVFDTSKVVADMEHVAPLQEGPNPAVLALNEIAVNKDDVVTAEADNLVMAFAGAFVGTPKDGITETVLIKSSKRSQLVEAMMAQMMGAQIARDFAAGGVEYPLAVRLNGKFKTAFPEGTPKPSPTPGNPEKPEEKSTEPSLKESSQPTTIVLVGDADMIQDPLAIRELGTLTGQRLIIPSNSNLSFAQSIVEQLAGDSNLISVRSRASRERPFTVVQKLQADAEANYQNKIRELEDSLAETQRKMNELQRSKGEDGQRFILSPEQQQELVNFRKTEANVKGQLKDMRRELRASIDSLENRIKWLNIAGMPAVVILAGFAFSMTRRKRAG